MHVVVDSLLTHYAIEGKGRLVLLLHGWGDNTANWRAVSAVLAKRYRVVAVDLPGFGGSEPPKTAWDLSSYAQFVQHFLHKIDAPPVDAIIGHSNGGAIAIKGVGSGTLQAKKLILLAAAGIRGEYKGRTKALRVFTKIGKALSAPLPNSIKKKLRSKVYSSIGSDMLVAEHLQETFKKIVNDDVREDAIKISVPTLLLYGQADTQTPVWHGEAYHQLITGSTLQILPGGGHFMHQECQTEITTAIEEFIDAPTA